jgi:3-oxoacyl-[acyl-carrier protein] reductase
MQSLGANRLATAGRLHGRTAFITGGGSGIGEATARLFVEEGARVVIAGRRLAVAQSLAGSLGPGAFAVACDVTDPESVSRAIHEAESAFGDLDAVVNCAGIVEPATIADLDPVSWQHTIATNLSGTFYVSRECALRIRRRSGHGSIVNIGSEMSVVGAPKYVAYCASKAALIGLTKALAAELAPLIRVNLVCPGPIDTPMLRAELALLGEPAELFEAESRRPLLGRIGQAVDVAAAIAHLTSSEAAFVTGAVYAIDGGTTIV